MAVVFSEDFNAVNWDWRTKWTETDTFSRVMSIPAMGGAGNPFNRVAIGAGTGGSNCYGFASSPYGLKKHLGAAITSGALRYQAAAALSPNFAQVWYLSASAGSLSNNYFVQCAVASDGTIRLWINELAAPTPIVSSAGAFPMDGNQHGVQFRWTITAMGPTGDPDNSFVKLDYILEVDNAEVFNGTVTTVWYTSDLPNLIDSVVFATSLSWGIGGSYLYTLDDVAIDNSSAHVSFPGGDAATLTADTLGQLLFDDFNAGSSWTPDLWTSADPPDQTIPDGPGDGITASYQCGNASLTKTFDSPIGTGEFGVRAGVGASFFGNQTLSCEIFRVNTAVVPDGDVQMDVGLSIRGDGALVLRVKTLTFEARHEFVYPEVLTSGEPVALEMYARCDLTTLRVWVLKRRYPSGFAPWDQIVIDRSFTVAFDAVTWDTVSIRRCQLPAVAAPWLLVGLDDLDVRDRAYDNYGFFHDQYPLCADSPGTTVVVDLEPPCEIKNPLYWATVYGAVQSVQPLASMGRPARDAVSFYGGFKAPRLKSLSPVTRAASDWFTGAWQAQQVAATFHDPDALYKAQLDPVTDAALTGASLWVYLTSEARRLEKKTPRLLFRGVVHDDPLAGDLTLTVNANDIISDGYQVFRDDKPVPQRRVVFPNFDDGGTHLGVPFIYGRVSDEDASSPAGKIKLINIGAITLNSVDYPACGLLCGHAIKEWENAYQNGAVIGGGEYGTNIFAPGWTGWTTIVPSGDLFVDFDDGLRYTLIPMAGTIADDFIAGKAVYVNVKGVETIGDGTGALITNLLLQYKHALINWIASVGGYFVGAWLDSPKFEWYPGGPQVNLVDSDSFDAADTLSGVFVGGGYQGGFVIGADGQRQSIREVIAQFNLCCNVMLGLNQFSQLFVRMLNPVRSEFVTDRTVRWQTDTLSGDDRGPKPKREWLVNVISGSWDKNYNHGAFEAKGSKQNDTSRGRYEDVTVARAYPMINDSATANDVMQRQVDFGANIPRIYTWSEGFCGLRHEMLECIQVRDYVGPGASGYVDRAMWIIKQTIDPMTNRVTTSAIDVEGLLE